MNKLISVRDLNKIYSSPGGDLHVLKNVTFDVAKGDMTALMGPSGPGRARSFISSVHLTRRHRGRSFMKAVMSSGSGAMRCQVSEAGPSVLSSSSIICCLNSI